MTDLTKEQRREIELQAARCRWFTPDEALQWAVAAYYRAASDLQPPDDRSGGWFRDGEPWSTPGDFAVLFAMALAERLGRQACEVGIAPPNLTGGDVNWGAEDVDSDPSFCALQRDNLPQCVDDVGRLHEGTSG